MSAGVTTACASQCLTQRSGDDVDSALYPAELGRPTSMVANKADGMGVVDHNQCVVLVGKITNGPQLGDVTIHGEDTIRCNEPVPGIRCILQLRLQIRHVTITVTKFCRLAEPDAVDDAGMIQFVRDDSVFRLQDCLKQPAVGIEAGTIEDAVVRSQESAQSLFQLLVNGLRTTDEANTRQPITPILQ